MEEPIKDILFISCGQRTTAEIKLGKDIESLVREHTSFNPYFAEAQTTLEGLTNNIFSMLNCAHGFIAVMHQRGKVNPTEIVRASVWIEQEIAIAAFLQQVFGKRIHVAAYLENGIGLEGVRSQLLLNPIEFKSNEDVLKHLESILPTWKVIGNSNTAFPLNINIRYEKKNILSSRHDYRLKIHGTNMSRKTITQYHVDLEVPKLLVENPKSNVLFIPDRITDTHYLFRVTHENHNKPIFPNDSVLIMSVPYFVEDKNYEDCMAMFVSANVYVEGYDPIRVEKSMKELQVF